MRVVETKGGEMGKVAPEGGGLMEERGRRGCTRREKEEKSTRRIKYQILGGGTLSRTTRRDVPIALGGESEVR